MAKTKIIDATTALRIIWNKTDPIKLVSINKNEIEIYMAIISTGWIKAVAAATVNRTLAVAQNTNVLNPYIKTQANNVELTNMSILIILEIMHPIRTNIPKIVMERPDRNIECFIFKFIP